MRTDAASSSSCLATRLSAPHPRSRAASLSQAVSSPNDMIVVGCIPQEFRDWHTVDCWGLVIVLFVVSLVPPAPLAFLGHRRLGFFLCCSGHDMPPYEWIIVAAVRKIKVSPQRLTHHRYRRSVVCKEVEATSLSSCTAILFRTAISDFSFPRFPWEKNLVLCERGQNTRTNPGTTATAPKIAKAVNSNTEFAFHALLKRDGYANNAGTENPSSHWQRLMRNRVSVRICSSFLRSSSYFASSA